MRPALAPGLLVLLFLSVFLLGIRFLVIPAHAEPENTRFSSEWRPDEALVSEAFEALHLIGDGVNAGAGASTALREGCRIAAQLGQMEADKVWDGLNRTDSPSNGRMQTAFDNFVIWLSGNVRNRLSVDQACGSLLGQNAFDTSGNEFSGSLKDAGINALTGKALALAQETGLPWLTRLEIEGGFTGDHPQFSVLTIQPLWEDRANGNFLFNQVSWQHEAEDKAEGNSDNTLNVGLAYRRLLMNNTLLLGANAFFDHEMDRNHNRVSIGVDAQTSLYGMAANRYIPLTGWKGIDRLYEERALAGWDLELSGRVPRYPDWTGYLRGFTWDSVNGEDDIYGVETNVEWSPVPAVVFSGGVTDENGASPDLQASMRLRLNFNQALDLQFIPRPGLENISDRVWSKVRRENTIRTQIRKRPSTELRVMETTGANNVVSEEENRSLSVGLTFNMPATITVENAPGAIARIRLANGGTLTLGQGTRVRIEPGVITLISGVMQYVSGSTNVIVNVPGGTVTLLGTDIDVVSDGTDSTVRVRDGSVRLAGTVSGVATVVAGGMAEADNGVVNPVAQGSPTYEAHTDEVSQEIDRVASPLTGQKVAPYPVDPPRIVADTTVPGQTVQIGLRFNDSVTVSGGTPRMTLTIGGNSRVAPLLSGSGTSDLIFGYTLQASDQGQTNFTVTSLDDNGSTLMNDGKPAVTTFADTTLSLSGPVGDVNPPAGYGVAFTTDPVNNANKAAVAFDVTAGEIGSTYAYTITSSGGAGSVTGSGTITTAPQSVTGINTTALPDGTLTLSVTLTDPNTNVGTPATDTVVKDVVDPSITFVTPPANGTYGP
jgi:hypothetical protein